MRYFNQYELYADLRTLVVNVNMQYYGYLGTINRRLRRWSKMSKKLEIWKGSSLSISNTWHTCLPMAARGEKLLLNENLLVCYSFEWLFRYFNVHKSCDFIVFLINASNSNHAKFIEVTHYLSHFVFRSDILQFWWYPKKQVKIVRK